MKAIATFSITMLKRFLRDPVYLFFMLVLPLIFLFIFGTVFGGNDNVNFDIAVINKSDSEFAKTFVESFEGEDNTAFTVNKELTNLDSAKEKMLRGEISSIIELPAGFGEVDMSKCDFTKIAPDAPRTPETLAQMGCAATALPAGEVQVYYDEGNPQAGQTVASIVNGILDEINAKMLGAEPPLGVKSISTGQAGMNQFDYTFAGLFAFTLMSMSVYGLSNQLPSEKKTGALRRIKATPFRPWQLIISLALVYATLTAISAAVMVGVGVVAFDWHIKGSVILFAGFSLLSVLAISGFGMLIAGAARNENQAAMASQLVAFPMMFLSGVFFPLYIMPSWMQAISNFIPLTPVAEGIRFITTENAGLIEVLPQLGLIGLWGVVAYFLAFRLFRWE
jgi:ABC-2 type transport system permease protein